MKRKLSVFITILTVILSISLVAFLGVRGEDTPQTIRVTDITFIDEKGERIEKNKTYFEKGVETLEVRFQVYPEDATNKDIVVEYDDGIENSIVECLPSKTKDGIIDIDFKGILVDQFYLRITSLDSASIETSIRYVAI